MQTELIILRCILQFPLVSASQVRIELAFNAISPACSPPLSAKLFQVHFQSI